MTADPGMAPTSLRLRDTMLAALAVALLTASLETILIFVPAAVTGGFVWSSRDHLWMATIGYMIVFAAAALVAWAGARVAPRRIRPYVVPVVLVSGAIFCLGIPFGELSRLALALLALGIGVQIARWSAPRAGAIMTAARITALLLLPAVAVVSLVMSATPYARERIALARNAPPPAGSPSILLIILDTVRAASMGIHNPGVPTNPRLARWAERGTVFDYAYATSPWTLPSHAGMFTGLWAHEMYVGPRYPFREPAVTLAEVLRDRGFATGGFVANLDYTGHESGLRRGFLRYEDRRRSRFEVMRATALGQTVLVGRLIWARSLGDVARAFRAPKLLSYEYPTRMSDRKRGAHVSREFLAWVDGLEGRPYFAFLNYFDAHDPYFCPPPFSEPFECGASSVNAYHGAIAYLDRELHRLFMNLERRGVLENTIVVITSDHGEHFGEHGLTGHGNSLYPQLTHVPMLVFGPGIPAGLRVSEPVSIRDLATSLARWAGVPPSLHAFPGVRLAAAWEQDRDSSATDAMRVQAAFGIEDWRADERAVVAGDRYVLREAEGVMRVFAVQDTAQAVDLASKPSVAPLLDSLNSVLR